MIHRRRRISSYRKSPFTQLKLNCVFWYWSRAVTHGLSLNRAWTVLIDTRHSPSNTHTHTRNRQFHLNSISHRVTCSCQCGLISPSASLMFSPCLVLVPVKTCVCHNYRGEHAEPPPPSRSSPGCSSQVLEKRSSIHVDPIKPERQRKNQSTEDVEIQHVGV